METIEFVYVTYIRTTPEKLWEALTNGDFSVKYWFGFRFHVELKAGGAVRILPPKGMEKHGDHAGQVLVQGNRICRNRSTCGPPPSQYRCGVSRILIGKCARPGASTKLLFGRVWSPSWLVVVGRLTSAYDGYI